MNNFDAIPSEMKAYRQWITWREEHVSEVVNGETVWKKTKMPYNPLTARKASVTMPDNWVTFDEALEVFQQGHYSGIGFVLTADDPYVFIDFDKPKDFLSREDQLEILNRQQKIYDSFDSYSEVSPSGAGLHIICKAPNLESGRRRGSIELYSSNRYMTMTGNVYGNKTDINERAELTQILYNEMQPKVMAAGSYQGSLEQKLTDDELYHVIINAENGAKAKDLIEGNWINYYQSQSEADFALINIISYYTDNVSQILRCFRFSALAKRDKAKRDSYLMKMVQFSFDRKLPPVDIEALRLNMVDAMQSSGGAAIAPGVNTPQSTIAVEAIAANPHPAPISNNQLEDWPTGLTGQIAKFFYHSSPRPIKEIAITGAIGYMAGIAGRAYNVSGTGLNQYILLLAGTGTGKESIASGISRLSSNIQPNCPTIIEYIGPSDFSSGSALIKQMVRQPSIVSVVGEFGLRLAKMENVRRSTSDIQLKAELLDLYGKSGHGEVKRPLVYSDKANNTAAINSPALTILGESVPETFYGNITEEMILQGFIPRFLVVEYKGKVPDLNENRQAQPDNDLRNQLMMFVATATHLNSQNVAYNIKYKPQAEAALKEFGRYCTAKVNTNKEDASKQLWNRAHLKLLKLSGLLAVGDNPKAPEITLSNVNWAKQVILSEIKNIIERFDKGRVGIQNKELKQEEDFKSIVYQYLHNDDELFHGTKVNPEMHHDKVIPFNVLTKLKRKIAFKDDYRGSRSALDNTIKAFIQQGALQELPLHDIREKYKYYGRGFVVLMPYVFGIGSE